MTPDVNSFLMGSILRINHQIAFNISIERNSIYDYTNICSSLNVRMLRRVNVLLHTNRNFMGSERVL